ncbi:SprB repeat-containing protein, partial [Phaeodactylibacter luteus]
GCTATATGTVSGGSALSLSFIRNNPDCFGGTDGSLLVLGSGGQPPYSYLWSTGGTGSSIGGLGAGPYTVTVTDALGCSEV